MSGPLRGARTSAVACRKHARRTLLVGILVAPPLNFHAYGRWPPLLPCISASSRAKQHGSASGVDEDSLPLEKRSHEASIKKHLQQCKKAAPESTAGSNLQAWAQELDRSHASPGAQSRCWGMILSKKVQDHKKARQITRSLAIAFGMCYDVKKIEPGSSSRVPRVCTWPETARRWHGSALRAQVLVIVRGCFVRLANRDSTLALGLRADGCSNASGASLRPVSS